MQREERFTRADGLIKLGFWVNAVLMIMKLSAGYYGKSEAVFADGVESAADFVAILTTMLALKISRQRHDENHPYGHGKAESLSAMLVALVIFATGGGILYKAIITIISGQLPQPELIAVGAAVATVLIKETLFRYTDRHGRELGSPAVTAIAKDHRKDAVTSVATVVGVSGAFLGFPLLDPLAAALTSLFIFHIGWETFRHAAHDLMDGVAPPEMLTEISALAEAVDGVEHVHEIRGRRSGQYLIIDLKLEMDPDMTVKRSHDIATAVKKAVFAHSPMVGDVMIHINPHDDPDHEDMIRL